MSRPSRVRAMALGALLAAAGCQDYNFNPVGHCLISPNTKRVELSNISTADVLFVIDDSGSMGGEQVKLSEAFTEFINDLDDYNQKKVAAGQTPFDFHLAVTTTSVFYNDMTTAQCRSDCPGASSDGNVCCTMSGAVPVSPYVSVKKCTGASDTSCGGTEACRQDCKQYDGEWVCCDPSTQIPKLDAEVSCAHEGDACGTMTTHYLWDNASPGCDPGHAVRWSPYPAGDFVADPTAARVVHFDKELYTCGTSSCTNKQGLPAATLKTMFTKNVVAGTCGSNQEQALQAAKLAIEKARAHQQHDVFSTTDGSTRGDFTADWLHDNAKLVLVFVGDEDDCSNPPDPSSIVMNGADPGTATEACVADAALPPEKQKEYSVTSFVDYFTTLPGDRPLSAAFIVSARGADSDSSCSGEGCYADICCDRACTGTDACTSKTCGGQAKGSRLLEAAAELRTRTAGKMSVDVIAGSICDGNFGSILKSIADITKPPNGLLLPTQPADAAVSVLRIAGSNGKTRKTCFGPAPANLSAAEARAAGYDWWYTSSRDATTDADQHPALASRFVLINHGTGNCEANPGETYSADYIARLPTAGCSGATAEEADASCVSALGGRPGDWTCFAGTDSGGACVLPTGSATGVVGTCLCGARGGPAAGTPGAGNCPNG